MYGEALGASFQASHLPIAKEEEVAMAVRGKNNGDEPGTQN